MGEADAPINRAQLRIRAPYRRSVRPRDSCRSRGLMFFHEHESLGKGLWPYRLVRYYYAYKGQDRKWNSQDKPRKVI